MHPREEGTAYEGDFVNFEKLYVGPLVLQLPRGLARQLGLPCRAREDLEARHRGLGPEADVESGHSRISRELDGGRGVLLLKE